MKKVWITGLILAGALRADTQPVELMQKMRQAYSRTHDVHIVVSRTDEVQRGARSAQTAAEFDFAERTGGSYAVRFKQNDLEAIAVSDGTRTWKANPKKREWSEIEAAGVSPAASEDASDIVRPHDLHGIAEDMLLTRYLAIAKLAESSEVVKEENYKLGKQKTRCVVVRAKVAGSTHELWIDPETGFVLQHVQLSVSSVDGAEERVKITTKVKLFETDAAATDQSFHFEPESSWKQVDMLVLPGEQQMALIGLRAGNFKMKSLEGEAVELSTLRGKVVVLDFWATWCPPCRRELPSIERLRNEFTDQVQFLGVNDEDAATVKSFLHKNGYALPVLMDQRRSVHLQYGVEAIPTVLIIDRDGVIRKHFVGSRSEAALRAAIAEVARR